jgi:hypothetical protein
MGSGSVLHFWHIFAECGASLDLSDISPFEALVSLLGANLNFLELI